MIYNLQNWVKMITILKKNKSYLKTEYNTGAVLKNREYGFISIEFADRPEQRLPGQVCFYLIML